MVELLKKILLDKSMTISVAESCTGGHLQALLASISGSSKFFEGGICAYNIDQKVKHLNVNREEATEVNCISQSIADQMALGVSKMFETRVAASTTGYISDYYYCSIVVDNEVVFRGKFNVISKDWDEPDRVQNQKSASIEVLRQLLFVLNGSVT